MRSFSTGHYSRRLLAATMLTTVAVLPAFAAVVYDGVAAGDMSTNDAILWTRADNGNAPATLTAQVSTDPAFGSGVTTFNGTTSASSDYTLKLDATGLTANTKYYYRFTDGVTTSPAGSFSTVAAGGQAAELKFAFSGDTDGRFRPFTLLNGFGSASQPQSQNLKFFTFLGDTMYETASTGSVGVTSPTPALNGTSTAAQIALALPVYRQKYLEVVSGVNPATGMISASGQQGLQNMFASTGTYTLLDNHELGNAALQSGGAPLTATPRVAPGATPSTPGPLDVNTTGLYNNQSAAYKTIAKAFLDYHPTRAALDGTLTSTGPTVNAPADPRSNGTPQQYFSQQQGKNAVYIQLDDRSYRDARLGTTGGADDVTSGRQLNPNRTMLGSTQLAWFKQSLLAAQAAGTPWKFVAISTPIDQTGPVQDGKSWYGGYTAERNDLLKFIADNHIQNVVFLTTDDHLTRMTPLTYLTNFNDPTSTAVLPGAFQIVTGPMGAGGPDGVTDHSFANLQTLLGQTNSGLQAFNEPTIGLCGFTGVTSTHRQLDPSSGSGCSAVDFFSPDTFNYTVLDVSADGSALTVDTYGIPSYQQNTFPQNALAPTDILGFTIAAGFTASVPEPGSLVLLASGVFGLAGLRRRR